MIVVTTHQDTDFDAAAGMLAATLLHPGAVVCFPGAKQEPLRRYLASSPELLPEVRSRDVELSEVETLVLVDTLAPERIGRFAELLEPGRHAARVVAYDHHPVEREPAGVELHSRAVGAVTTLMASLLRERGILPSPEQATFLAAGIYEDTGGLLHPGTTPEDLEAVAWLVRHGADLGTVSRTLERGLSPEQVDLYHALLHESRTVRIHGRRVELALLNPVTFVHDASVVVQQFASSTGARRVVVLLRMEDRVFVIVRSRAADFDAAALARALGGGGHPHAASATVRDRTLVETGAEVRRVLAEVVRPAATAADLATPILHWLPADVTVAEGVRRLNRFRVNGLPIMECGRVVGAFTRQSADIALHHNMGRHPVRDLVAGGIELLPPDADVDAVKDRLLSGGARFLLVGESPERVRGVITRSTVLRWLGDEERVEAAESGPRVREAPTTRQDLSGLLRRRLPHGAVELLRGIGEEASRLGANAYLVGGVVRDLLLDRPNRDLDVVVEGDACAVGRGVADRLGGRLKIHEAFQTARVLLPDDLRVDLATARTEHYPRAGDLPDVTPGSLRQDLFRRDFTINTLAISLAPETFGTVLDVFGARKDLALGKIRALHGLSFIEDPTRAFRALRFALRLDFEIARETAHLIRIARRRGAFVRLSGPRLRRELEQLFAQCPIAGAVRALAVHDLLRVVHPRLRPGRRDLARLDRLDAVLGWRSLEIGGDAGGHWAMAVGTLASRLDEATREALWQRLAPGRRDLRILREIPASMPELLQATGEGDPSPSAIHAACRGRPEPVLLVAMAAASSDAPRRAIARYLTDLRRVRPDVRGADLLELGVPAGPAIAEGLEGALRAKLDGRAPDRESQLVEALAIARRVSDARDGA